MSEARCTKVVDCLVLRCLQGNLVLESVDVGVVFRPGQIIFVTDYTIFWEILRRYRVRICTADHFVSCFYELNRNNGVLARLKTSNFKLQPFCMLPWLTLSIDCAFSCCFRFLILFFGLFFILDDRDDLLVSNDCREACDYLTLDQRIREFYFNSLIVAEHIMISQLNLSLGEASINARFNFDVLERHNLFLLFPDPSKAASLVAALFLFEFKRLWSRYRSFWLWQLIAKDLFFYLFFLLD